MPILNHQFSDNSPETLQAKRAMLLLQESKMEEVAMIVEEQDTMILENNKEVPKVATMAANIAVTPLN